MMRGHQRYRIYRSWLSEKLAGKRPDFKETDVKKIKTKS